MAFALPHRPARALLHPAWLGALAVLVLNDHVLKGSGLLPGVVTGKLSDVAGLIVAPVLFATILRVRSRRGWTMAHVAVGAVFTALQLSPAISAAWSALMQTVAFGWVTTMDPSDLLALPALLVSWHVFGRPLPTAAAQAKHSLELAAATTGVMMCAATSPGPGEPFRASIFTDVYIHNGGDTDMIIRVRTLAPEVDLDCSRVADDPGRLLQTSLFGDVQSWTVAPGVNHGLLFNNEWDRDESMARECNVVLFEADNVPARIVFWNDGDPAAHTVEGEGLFPDDPGLIEIGFDDEGRGRYLSGERFLSAPVSAPPISGECGPQADGERLAWSGIATGTWTLLAMDLGLDGCWALDLSRGGNEDRMYLCAPMGQLPFAVGDQLEIDSDLVGEAQGEPTSVDVRHYDATSGALLGRVQLVRSAQLGDIDELTFGVVPDFSCDYAAEPVCGTVARAASLTVYADAYGSAQLRPGDAAPRLEGPDGSAYEVYLAHAQERVVLDPECAEGPDTLGTDLEVAVVFTAAPLPE